MSEVRVIQQKFTLQLAKLRYLKDLWGRSQEICLEASVVESPRKDIMYLTKKFHC